MNNYNSIGNNKKIDFSNIPKTIEEIGKQWEHYNLHINTVQNDILNLERMYTNYGNNNYYLILRSELLHYRTELLNTMKQIEESLNEVKNNIIGKTINY